MDDVLTSSKVEALMVRELASRVLTRLGIERNEKKGQWELTRLVEHLVMEVDLATGLFRVTPARLQKIHVQSPTRAKLHTDSSLFAWGGVLSLKHATRGDELRHLHITHLELEAVYKTVQLFLRELTGKVVRVYCDNQAIVAMLSHFTSRNPELMRHMRRLWLLLDLNDIELQASCIRSETNEWADRLSRDTNLDGWRLNQQWFDRGDTEWHKHTVDRFASELSTQLPGTTLSGTTRVKTQILAARNAETVPHNTEGMYGEDQGTEAVEAARGGSGENGGGGDAEVEGGGGGKMGSEVGESDEMEAGGGGGGGTGEEDGEGSERGEGQAEAAMGGMPMGAWAGRSGGRGNGDGASAVGGEGTARKGDRGAERVKRIEEGGGHGPVVGEEGTRREEEGGHSPVAAAAKPQPTLALGSRVEVYWPIDNAWYSGREIPCGSCGCAKGERVDEWDTALEERWRIELGESSLMELAVQMQGAALQDTTLGKYRPKAVTFMQLGVAEGWS
ncbi:hypothetical protein CYMTET_13128 [Cymbomonas tetramitiformis]|uniref:RNase H type-1 domain-containing protein n=1 Tax=Cymbomonas tetramitiformis TaxID=36881 RepID=A0AAE0GIQ7_9CHLO|nr:hypothetical protein CYMTET_13128 [Cymbomonas tetramitiformis]